MKSLTTPTDNPRPGSALRRHQEAQRHRLRDATPRYIQNRREILGRGTPYGLARRLLTLCGNLRNAVAVLYEIEEQR